MSAVEAPAAVRRAAAYRQTDTGNALRVVARNVELVRYAHDSARWHIWDGRAWAPDATGQIDRFASAAVAAMWREVDAMPAGDDDGASNAKAKASQWALLSEGAGKLAAMVKVAERDERVACTAEAFDTNPWELNTPGGIVDLRTGALRPHDPAAMHSCIAAATPRLRATLQGTWPRFIKRVLPDAATRLYVQKLLGASLVGAPLPGAAFPFVFGPGGTGKSTMLESVLAALGDYAGLAPDELLAAKRGGFGGGSVFDMAALRGKRFVLASEGEAGQVLAVKTVKLITDSPMLTAQQKHEAERTTRNVTALWYMSNHEPRIDGTDSGLGRRLKEIPMDVVLHPKRDLGLRDKIIAEHLDDVLAWCIEGCVLALTDGLDAPDTVTAATKAYLEESNPLLQWFDQRCERDAESFTSNADLHAAYGDWCAASKRWNAYGTGPTRAWGTAMGGLGLMPAKLKGARGYTGVRLLTPGI